MLRLCVFAVIVGVVLSYSPLTPQNGYTYALEAAHSAAWPSCPYRFLSYPNSCDNVDMWNAVGKNQWWTLISSGDSFYLKSSCGKYLSYPGDCSNTKTIDLWSEAGINQKFRFIKGNNDQFNYYIEAVGREQCEYRYLSFPSACTSSSPDHVDFWTAAGENQRFRLYPVAASSSSPIQPSATQFVCPDPFAWQPRGSTNFRIQCTGGGIHLGTSKSIEPGSAYFTQDGDCLGGTPAEWASISYPDSRWAPENFETTDGYNFLIFSDSQSSDSGKHRLGYVVSKGGVNPSAYNIYSPSYLHLGDAPGGDIDSTVFQDTDGKSYLIWKTDDNSVGSTTTRIWSQQVSFANATMSLVGSPRVLMDSTGLWWVDSWVNGGSLVEGPEMIKRGDYYYLFFAAGKFCQDTYTEGVARSRSLFGPYEKMQSPLLSNGIVGRGRNPAGVVAPLVGPGHAAIVDLGGDSYRIVWHASVGENCDRYAFVNRLVFNADGWPYVEI